MRTATCLVSWILLSIASLAHAQIWETIDAKGQPTARHEAAFVAYKGKAYLIGGRRINPVDVFDPTTKTWTAKSETPIELHHFQAVVVDDAIYLIGAMTGPWPNEKPVEKIVVYYPETDEFKFIHSIPESRRRGGAGAALHDGKIYIVGGITNGHMDGCQPWLDVYDPHTGGWTPLEDAPHARDHFQAVVHQGRLYALAGRTTSQRTNQGFDLTVPFVDVYDFETNRWLPHETCPSIPTGRAGNMAMAWGGAIIVGGGESGTQQVAHSEVDALDIVSKTWRKWPRLQRGRHGSGFAIIGDYAYTASGSGDRGGGPELTSIEKLNLSSIRTDNQSSVQQWHTKTLSFRGPKTFESATPNPFTDYRLQVTFTHPEVEYVIRGFYAADGNAAETSAVDGGIWQARFSPDRPGNWQYRAELRHGHDIAIEDGTEVGSKVLLDNSAGSFQVQTAPIRQAGTVDFRNRGKLIADGGYFRFGKTGRRWLKGGSDSPENLLAYADFDGTFRMAVEESDGEATPSETLHGYQAHVGDWNEGEPVWQNGKGKGLVGAVNYLSSTGMNAVYFLTMNIGGDGKDVWPYLRPDNFTRFDCSKLDQWELVFEHMQKRGVMLHVVTQETENERMLDDGETGRLRKIYYQELISRFAHHPALVWNLGEENGPADFSPNGQTARQQTSMATYLKASDPYHHPVVIHTHSTPAGKDEVLPPLLGHKALDGLSFQVNSPETVHGEVARWRQLAAKANRPWLIGMEEIGPWHTGAVPDADDPNHDTLRRHVLWGSLMAGACGVEWYFGAKFPHNDLTSEDWRQRAAIWRQTKHALDFFERNLPYWEMQPADRLTTTPNTYCFAKEGHTYALYVQGGTLTEGQELTLNIKAARGFRVAWYDPVLGGAFVRGTVAKVTGAQATKLGKPHGDLERDWVVFVDR